MITQKTELLNAMMEAYQMEKGLWEFYGIASSRADGRDVREAFDKLRGWENEHMRYIQHLYQSIRDEREMLTFEQFKTSSPPTDIEGGVPIAEAASALGKREIGSERDALNVALEVEIQARDLYRRLTGSVEDTNTRVFLQDMVRQEERHIDFVTQLMRKSNPPVQ